MWFVQGRFIGEFIRTIQDVMNYTKGFSIFLDFEQAFDSLEWIFSRTPIVFVMFLGVGQQPNNYCYRYVLLCFSLSSSYLWTLSSIFEEN